MHLIEFFSTETIPDTSIIVSTFLKYSPQSNLNGINYPFNILEIKKKFYLFI